MIKEFLKVSMNVKNREKILNLFSNLDNTNFKSFLRFFISLEKVTGILSPQNTTLINYILLTA
jgi:hypothetical protein